MYNLRLKSLLEERVRMAFNQRDFCQDKAYLSDMRTKCSENEIVSLLSRAHSALRFYSGQAALRKKSIRHYSGQVLQLRSGQVPRLRSG